MISKFGLGINMGIGSPTLPMLISTWYLHIFHNKIPWYHLYIHISLQFLAWQVPTSSHLSNPMLCGYLGSNQILNPNPTNVDVYLILLQNSIVAPHLIFFFYSWWFGRFRYHSICLFPNVGRISWFNPRIHKIMCMGIKYLTPLASSLSIHPRIHGVYIKSTILLSTNGMF